MFLLKDKLRQVIAKKHLTQNMMGVLALNAVRDHFWFTNNPLLIDWFLKFNVLFVKTPEQHIKIKIFQEKTQLVDKIHQSWKTVGYEKILKDIRTQ
jgi:hypothetical protein